MFLKIHVPTIKDWQEVCDICFENGQRWIDGQKYHLEYLTQLQQKPITIVIPDYKNIFCQSKSSPADWSVNQLKQFLEAGNKLPKPKN